MRLLRFTWFLFSGADYSLIGVRKFDILDAIHFIEESLLLLGIDGVVDNQSGIVCADQKRSIVREVQRVNFGALEGG